MLGFIKRLFGIGRKRQLSPVDPEAAEAWSARKSLLMESMLGREHDMVKCFGLLAVIEVFRSEMEYARKAGTEKPIARLKEAGHYPYSDLERQPVA